MTDTKFTPGEWSYSTTDKGRPKVVDQNGFTVATAGAQPYNHADFKLLATAPRMYEALEALTEWARGIAGDCDDAEQRDKENAMIERMDAILAQARGETDAS